MQAKSSGTETLVGIVILLTLGAIAAGVLVKQSRYDVSIFTVTGPSGGVSNGAALLSPAPGADIAGGLQNYLPPGFTPLSPPETYGPDNLSDKINGKAELYLSAGFVALRCGRFKRTDAPDLWLELFIYDMGNMRNAFSVYSVQRRADARKADVARFAYATENALFFVHGKEYVEVVASREGMDGDLLAFGRNITAAGVGETEAVSELLLFPPENLDETSISLHSRDVFGFDRLDNTFTAKYDLSGTTVTAFISSRASSKEAEELAAAYRRFLVENGGKASDLGGEIAGGVSIEIFDVWEVVLHRGNLLAGVHEAEDREAAAKLAAMLYRSMNEVVK